MNCDKKLALLWACLCLAIPVSASADPAAESSHEFNHNIVGVFVGATGEGRRENGLTFALTYGRRFHDVFAVGVEVERVFGDLEFWVATVPFAYHVKKWKFFAGPGIEDPDDGDAELMVRVGAEYGFELNEQWEFAPTLSLDFVDGETVAVFGVGFLYGY